MEKSSPEKPVDCDREFRSAVSDLEPLIRNVNHGAVAVTAIGLSIVTDGDSDEGKAVLFVGEQLEKCAAELKACWLDAHTAMGGGPEVVEQQKMGLGARVADPELSEGGEETTVDQSRDAGLAILAEGFSSLRQFEEEADNIVAAFTDPSRPVGTDEYEAWASRSMDRLEALEWAIAEGSAKTNEDMAVKVRLIVTGLNAGRGVWDHRTAETLLEALDGPEGLKGETGQ